jgi:shikimate dehydrogenase
MTLHPHEINGHTRLTGILGWPVGHSLSPAMHNAEFARLNLNWVYVPLGVEPNHLATAVRGLAAAGFAGFNVTIPHKQAVLPLMDDLTVQARQIGAVNTVRIMQDRLLGMNTDADGWAQDCSQLIALKGIRVAIAGAGGAARAVAVAAAHAGVSSVAIINRTLSSAEHLAKLLQEQFPGLEVLAGPREEDGPGRDMVAAADLLVNTTPLGMGAPDDSLAVPASWLRRDLAVYDTVYTPAMTATLRVAAALGAPYRGGLGMLARQGALSFEAWTGIQPSVEAMENTLRQKLGLV